MRIKGFNFSVDYANVYKQYNEVSKHLDAIKAIIGKIELVVPDDRLKHLLDVAFIALNDFDSKISKSQDFIANARNTKDEGDTAQEDVLDLSLPRKKPLRSRDPYVDETDKYRTGSPGWKKTTDHVPSKRFFSKGKVKRMLRRYRVPASKADAVVNPKEVYEAADAAFKMVKSIAGELAAFRNSISTWYSKYNRLSDVSPDTKQIDVILTEVLGILSSASEKLLKADSLERLRDIASDAADFDTNEAERNADIGDEDETIKRNK